MPFKMVDVSSNNHVNEQPITWENVYSAGYRGVMIKATEGIDYTNPWMERDAKAAHGALLHVGYYHYARPAVGNAAEQATYALDAIQGLPRDIGLALDFEETGGLSWELLQVWCKNFLAEVASHKCGSPLYTDPDFMAHMPEAPFGHKLWLASWGRRPRRAVWAWQSGEAVVPGIPGLTDVGWYYGA